jgi:hypothetical protein
VVICAVGELESAFPRIERLHGQVLLGAELRDGKTALSLAANAIVPECVELGVSSSRHGLSSCEGIIGSALQVTMPGKNGYLGRLLRQSKDEYIRKLYARLGPEEFYRRRLEWLFANGKWKSYDRLVAYLEKAGINCFATSSTCTLDEIAKPHQHLCVRRAEKPCP